VAYGIASTIVDGNDVVAVYNATKNAVTECRAGRGPHLIEVKTMRMRGHAQHDPAEYVPKEMFEYWKARDPLVLYEKYLTENKIWDEKTKSEIDARIERELDVEQKFAEDSPMPPPEFAEVGVYCDDGCHKIAADWKRAKTDVMPPKSSFDPGWKLEDLGRLGEIPTAKEVAASGGNGAQASTLAPRATPALPPQSFVNVPAPRRQSTQPAAQTEVAEPVEPRIPFGRGPKDKAFRESPDNPQNKSYGRGGTQGKTFRKGAPEKAFNKGGQNKSFAKNPPGKNFSKGPQDKSGRR
jgi:hypothetical protein